jgi:prepilin-type N-terminal cleavage/methylation domain-containing protein
MNRDLIELRAPRRRGFTLIELLTVIIIISIILGFIVVASMDATHRAEERATQSLITKLEQGLNDRLEALLQTRPEPNYSHGYLAAVYNTLAQVPNSNPLGMIPPQYIPVGGVAGQFQINPAVRTTDRAQVIAWYDYIKNEMPDVFYIDPQFYANSSSYSGPYPLNFAAVPFLTNSTTFPYNYVLPLGNSVMGNFGDGLTTNPSLGLAGSGIFGASYGSAAGLYKNLGYVPAGYDGIDNDQDGFIDNWAEGVPANGNNSALVLGNLGRHTHNTARAETLYAILVEGTGPLGSIFDRDDFTDKEVQDTDGDGMPEFVDAWGQPIQFFRWPLYYHSDLQRGQNISPDASIAQQWDLIPPYMSMFEQREQNPLDPNQQLVAPGWWSTQGNGGIAANNIFPGALVPYAAPIPTTPTSASGGVQAFEALFHSLSEPLPNPGLALGQYWDRGSFYPARRAFYSKFLILSGGQDKQPGVFLYSDAGIQSAGLNASQILIANENSAMPFGLDVGDFTSSATVLHTTFPATSSNDPAHPSTYDLQQAAQDDISNHAIQSGGSIGGSG